MKPAEGKAIIKNVTNRGWIGDGDTYWPPNSPQAEILRQQQADNPKKKKKRSELLKTGWIDDTRNIRNREKQMDVFIRLVKQELGLEVWPEFHFLTAPDPDYRFDYAIPINPNSVQLKIAIEQEGGVWAKGNSGHSSGTGIMRDMKKSSLAAVNGWVLIRRTPDNLVTNETLELIKKAVSQITGKNIPEF